MTFNFGGNSFKNQPGYGYSGVSKAANLVPASGSALSALGGGVKKGRGRKTPMAIIIEPARELAQQTHDNITLFKKHLPSPGIRWVGGQLYYNKIERGRYIVRLLEKDFWN